MCLSKSVVLSFVLMLFCQLGMAQRWAVSTNLVDYAAFATLNAEASYAPSRHWSLDLGVKYNPYTFHGRDGQFQHRQLAVYTGARWWPWHIFSGWWLSTKVQYRQYNIGGILSDETEEGDKIGAGITAGYTYMIHPRLNLEFGIGFWGGWKWYTRYACPKCGMTIDSGSKAFVLPNDLMISLSYVF